MDFTKMFTNRDRGQYVGSYLSKLRLRSSCEILIVDPNIDDFQTFLGGIRPGTEVFVLDSARDGVQQITDILIPKRGISCLHIVSHGESGCLKLGTTRLDGKTINRYAKDWELWKLALQPQAEILLYGCNVAEGDRGIAFVQELSQRTGAYIAASTNLTGSKTLGGDWELQFKTGEIQTELAIQSSLKESYGAVLHAGHDHSSLPLLPLITSGTFIARINAGGGSYVDSLGKMWSADQNFVGTSYTYGISQVIAGTNDSALYQNERSGINSSSFAYEIPVTTPGIYNVNLHFAELYWQQAGQRIFDVDIEGQSFLNDFDILLEGGAKTALTKSTRLAVTDGGLSINFEATTIDNPEVTAIEILREGDIPPSSAAGVLAFGAPTFTVNENGTPVSSVTVTRTGGSSGAVGATIIPTEGTALAPADFTNTPITVSFLDGDTAAKTVLIPIVNDTVTESAETINLALGNVTGGASLGTQKTAILSIVDNDSLAKILINAGGSQYTDIAGQVWSADQFFSSNSYQYIPNPLPAIASTNDQSLYQNERSGVNGNSFSYQVPVTNGTYLVNLNFAELYWNAAGKRVFNVNVEGQPFLQNFDIWSQTGGQNRALTKSAQATVNDGILNINFSALVDNAEITSIEILKTSEVPPSPVAGTLAFSSPTFAVNEDGTVLSAVTVSRIGGSTGAISATVSLNDGTAIAPNDYTKTPILVNFADGDSTAKTIIVPINNDTLQERVEGINLSLGNITGGAVLGFQNTAILSIVDNDLNSGFSTLTWQTETNATETVSEALGAAVDGNLYLFGGFNTDDFISGTSQRVSVYNPATNTWTRKGDMPTKLTHSPTIVDGHTVYFIGGYDGLHPKNYSTTAVWKYDTINDTWTPFVPLPVPRGAGGAALVNHADNKRYIHFFGGTNTFRTADSGDHFVLCLDDPNPTWVTAASMPNPRNHLGGVGINGKVYAVGGQFYEENNSISQAYVDIYDPATNTWKPVASLPKPRSQMGGATFVMGDRIIVAGGVAYNPTIPFIGLADVTAYDPVTNKWTELTPLPAITNSGVAHVIGSEMIYTTGYDYKRDGQGNFTWSGLPLTPAVDTTAPTANFNVINITTAGTSKQLTVTYTDNVAVDVTDLNNSDIRITGPNGFNQLGTFVSVNTNTNGTPRTATYQIVGPGGGWDNTDNGLYTVLMEPNQVSDTSNNNFVASGSIGNFTVNIPTSNTIRIEAESMNLSVPPNSPSGSVPYRIEANSSASGGNLISLKNGGATETGFANYAFTGIAGKYDVVLGYYDENETNGDAKLEVKQGNTVLDSWTLNLKLGSVDAVPQTFVRRKIATAISIIPGDIFQLKGIESPGEKARIDYLEFIPL